jgi:hypothetical protein
MDSAPSHMDCLARSLNEPKAFTPIFDRHFGNKQGTGHGRPWLPTVTPAEAQIAIRTMGSITLFLLSRLAEKN